MKPLILVIAISFSLIGCESGEDSGTLDLSGSSSSGGSVSSAASDALAYIEFYRTLDGTSSTAAGNGLFVSCEIPAGSLAGTDIDCPSFSMDESVLFNSSITIKWGTKDVEACPFIKFYPYYYRASNSIAFHPEWVPSTSADINCSNPAASDSKSCYGGIAPLLSRVGYTFPTLAYFVSFSSIVAEDEVTILSANSLKRTSNRTLANPPSTYLVGAPRSMADGSDGIVDAFPGSYTGELQNLQNYQVVCEDNFADPIYSLNFYLRDHDITPAADNADDPVFNDYADWDSSLNTIDPQ